MYNIGVIGTGFVGSALLSHLEEKFQVSSYDLSDATEINLGYERVVSESNIIYVCVPTPADKNGKCNTLHVDNACKLINYYAKRVSKLPIVLIKSTVPPCTTERLQEKYEHCILVSNPEFLTERTALEDVKKTTKHLLGIQPSERLQAEPREVLLPAR